MFCPTCGTAQQTPDSYCRQCGEFLADLSDKFSLLNRVLGIHTPEKQVNINLAVSLLTAILSSLLIIFLLGYFGGRFARTGESTPSIIYLVYLFLGLVAVWQFLSVINNISLRNRLTGRLISKSAEKTSTELNTPKSGSTQELLPSADFENIPASSVTEGETKILNEVRRQ
jgi:hypothetical protein